MSVYIHSGAMLTCHGGTQATWSALLAGKRPTPTTPRGHRQEYPLAIMDLDGPLGSSARLDGLLARGFATLPDLPSGTALVCATTKAAVDELFEDDLPATGQVYQITARVAEILSLTGTTSCVSAACASGTIAIIQGALRILRGECEHALIVGFDLMSDFVIGGFASLKALSPTSCRPFDRERDGLALGEGFGWMLLSKQCSRFNGGDTIFQLKNWGISCDATHITAPCRHGSGLLRALSQTLSGNREAPGGINAHGTGTTYNDAMELTAFSACWPDLPPLCSVKGAIGHCLGAAGVIEALLSLKSLEEQCLPPTVGLRSAEERAEGKISGSSPLPLDRPTVLSCNSGFGGINAALLFSET